MIEFSKIDKDFKVYKNTKVYLFGASKIGRRCKKILEHNGVHICGFIDNDVRKHGIKFCGIRVISFSDFMEIARSEKNTLAQITSTFESEIMVQMEESGFDNYISYAEFSARTKQLSMYLATQNDRDAREIIYKCDLQNNLRSLVLSLIKNDYFSKKMLFGWDTLDIALSPYTVGNDAIKETIKQNSGRILIPLQHSCKWIDKEAWNVLKKETIRVVMGVREPIAQNISLMYQLCGNDFWDLEEFWDGGGDVQKIFDEYIIGNNEKRCWYNIYREEGGYNFLVQNFFETQVEPLLGIDIYEYPFDKEKGYSIIKCEKISIFIYQVEKISSLYDKVAAFFDIENAKPNLNVNMSENKWCSRSYKEAKKSLRLSREYFENCYSSRYIKHFYSDEDIEKFKGRWEQNVR